MSVLRVLQFTDPHLSGSASGALRGVQTLPALKRVLACARMRDWPVDAMLVTGDIVNDDPAGYPHFRQLFADFGVPVLCIPGNHDDLVAMRLELRDRPFVHTSPVDIGSWRIVLLDSCLPDSAQGRLSTQALNELDRALSSAGNRHVLMALHHHPVSMSSQWLDAVGLQNANEFFQILDRYPSVKAITWGHVHQAFDGLRNGVRLLATPSTCTQFMPHANEFTIDVRPPAYRTLQLHPNGEVISEVVWIDPERALGGAVHSGHSAA